MKVLRIATALFSCCCLYAGLTTDLSTQDQFILETKQFVFSSFPNVFNPSIIEVPEGFLVSFRYIPDLNNRPYCSYVGLFVVNENLEVVVAPYLLNTRIQNQITQSQSEDARLFRYQDELWIVYNDNCDLNAPDSSDRRDIFIAELIFENGRYDVKDAIKLIAENHYANQIWQKNWAPFVWEDALFISYTISPHEVLYAGRNGLCQHYVQSDVSIPWEFGTIRASACPQLIEGEYVGIFHSAKMCSSEASDYKNLWHYFAGLYTFSPNPPFAITKISQSPILGKDFYTQGDYQKRVIFPGGFVIKNGIFYMAYGKDDEELWIAKIDWKKLRSSLICVE